MISDFSKKRVFASQFKLLSNTSILPSLTIRTDRRLLSLKKKEDDILSVTKDLNSGKSHGWEKLLK